MEIEGMIGVLVALKTIFEIDAIKTTLATLDAGLNIFGLFDIMRSKIKKDSLEYQIICTLEESLEESCKILNWEHDALAVSQVFNYDSIPTNTVMTKEMLGKLFSELVGKEIDTTDLDVIVDCFDKSVAGKDKLYRYLDQKWKRYLEEEKASSNKSLLSNINKNNKKYRISDNLIFVYDQSPFLFLVNDNEKVDISYEECCVISFLLRERGLVIPLNEIVKEYAYYAKNKHMFEKPEILVKRILLAMRNLNTYETKCKELIDKLIRLDKTRTLIKYVDCDSILINPTKRRRLTPKSVFELLKEHGRPQKKLDIFQNEVAFYEYLFPDLFYRLLSKNIESFDLLFNRQYLIESVLGYKVQELLLFNNNIKYLTLSKCKTVIECLESFNMFIDAFLKEFGDEPVSGLFRDGIMEFSPLESHYKFLQEKEYIQLYWCIGTSFIHETMTTYSLDISCMSEETDAMSLSMGIMHESILYNGKNNRSILYNDSTWLFEMFAQSNLFQPSELKIIKNSLNERSHFHSHYIDTLITNIQRLGFSIKIGMDVAVVTTDYQILYVEGNFIIESVSISGKQITDFQEYFFDVLDLQNTIGTIKFVSKNTATKILFSLGTDKLKIRMRHLVDIIINSNRVLSLAVIGVITHAPDSENNMFLIKPVLVEIIKTKSDQKKAIAFIENLKEESTEKR